jgi:hypothetical protein
MYTMMARPAGGWTRSTSAPAWARSAPQPPASHQPAASRQPPHTGRQAGWLIVNLHWLAGAAVFLAPAAAATHSSAVSLCLCVSLPSSAGHRGAEGLGGQAAGAQSGAPLPARPPRAVCALVARACFGVNGACVRALGAWLRGGCRRASFRGCRGAWRRSRWGRRSWPCSRGVSSAARPPRTQPTRRRCRQRCGSCPASVCPRRRQTDGLGTMCVVVWCEWKIGHHIVSPLSPASSPSRSLAPSLCLARSLHVERVVVGRGGLRDVVQRIHHSQNRPRNARGYT